MACASTVRLGSRRATGALFWTVALLVVGCGNLTSEISPTDEPPSRENIVWPDSYCDEETCSQGGCIPDGDTPLDGKPVCNAWLSVTNIAMQAVDLSAPQPIGTQDLSGDDRDDMCPGMATSPDDGSMHCCQRTRYKPGEPLVFRVAGMEITQPSSLALPSITAMNRQSMDEDRQNALMIFPSLEPGPVAILSKTGLPHEDGTFEAVEGTFELAGRTWNSTGRWDPYVMNAQLEALENGGLRVEAGIPGLELAVPTWIDSEMDFVSMDMTLRDPSYVIEISPDRECVGARVPGGYAFGGTSQSYMTVEQAMATNMVLSKTGPDTGITMCTFIAGVRDCTVPRSVWRSN